MADWMKMRTNLWDDPRVAAICGATGQTEATVVGCLYRLWSIGDEHSKDGFLPKLNCALLDGKVGVEGFAEAACDVGWLEERDGGLVIPRFDEHNSNSAKRRALDARRKAEGRGGEEPNPQDAGTVSASEADASRTDRGARERKELEREENKNQEEESKTLSSNNAEVDGRGADPPPSVEKFYADFQAAWHAELPMLPKVSRLTDKRRASIRSRLKDPEFVANWRIALSRARASPFLTGTQKGSTWAMDFEFFFRPDSVTKILEGKYDPRGKGNPGEGQRHSSDEGRPDQKW